MTCMHQQLLHVKKTFNKMDVQQRCSNSDIKTEGCSVQNKIGNDDHCLILWSSGLRNICLTALWLPLGALVICFVTASIFQWDDVHETHCRVYNVIPSISAITGISPQRYLWRISVALHLGPRFLIGSLYHSYHKQRSHQIVNAKDRDLALKLGEACYWLNLIEVFSLTGVTYISNRENYPIHEKIFTVFMISSLLHMLIRCRVGSIGDNRIESLRGNKIVWTLFAISMISTAGLIVSFIRHRFLCRPLAFTWFSFCEYVIACCNMGFHAVVMVDFPKHNLQICGPIVNKPKKDK